MPHGRRSSRSEPKLKQPNRLKTPTVPPLILFTKKGKHFAENKLKQHRQQVKTRQNQNADTPHTPQNGNISEVRNTPKQPNNALKTRANTGNVNKCAVEIYPKFLKLF